MGADVLPGQRHGIARGNQRAAHRDDAGILADRRRQQKLGRHRPPRHQHLGEQYRRQLADLAAMTTTAPMTSEFTTTARAMTPARSSPTVKADIGAADRGESVALMEPLVVGEGSRHRTGLTDLAVELGRHRPPRHQHLGEQIDIGGSLPTFSLKRTLSFIRSGLARIAAADEVGRRRRPRIPGALRDRLHHAGQDGQDSGRRRRPPSHALDSSVHGECTTAAPSDACLRLGMGAFWHRPAVRHARNRRD